MLNIKNLHVEADKKEIITGLSLNIRPAEIHVIMGPNGSGKSTLANAVAGKPGLKIKGGKVFLNAKNLLKMRPDQRARAGLFTAFQYPQEISGVRVLDFIQTALTALRKSKGKPAPNLLETQERLKKCAASLSINPKILDRYINEGFSGGEKKKMEILQMLMFEPEIAILDEIDSGLDIDALKTVAKCLKKMTAAGKALVIITHYQRILRYIKPHFVHVMVDGRIVKSGGAELGKYVERKGYKEINDQEPNHN